MTGSLIWTKISFHKIYGSDYRWALSWDIIPVHSNKYIKGEKFYLENEKEERKKRMETKVME